mgnify:FL=1
MVRELKNYNQEFWNKEDGVELIQFALIVVVTVGLFAVIFQLKDSLAAYIDKARTDMESQFDDALNNNPS